MTDNLRDGLDLFGNPLIEKRDVGRPEHEVTEEKIIFVMVLLSSGQTPKEVAETMGISVPTLRKHYLHLLKKKDVMLDRLRTKLQVTQIVQGLGGNATALGAALKQLETAQVKRAEKRVGERGATKPSTARPIAAEKVGKKEQRKRDALKVSGKFAPPEPPRLVVDNK